MIKAKSMLVAMMFWSLPVLASPVPVEGQALSHPDPLLPDKVAAQDTGADTNAVPEVRANKPTYSQACGEGKMLSADCHAALMEAMPKIDAKINTMNGHENISQIERLLLKQDLIYAAVGGTSEFGEEVYPIINGKPEFQEPLQTIADLGSGNWRVLLYDSEKQLSATLGSKLSGCTMGDDSLKKSPIVSAAMTKLYVEYFNFIQGQPSLVADAVSELKKGSEDGENRAAKDSCEKSREEIALEDNTKYAKKHGMKGYAGSLDKLVSGNYFPTKYVGYLVRIDADSDYRVIQSSGHIAVLDSESGQVPLIVDFKGFPPPTEGGSINGRFLKLVRIGVYSTVLGAGRNAIFLDVVGGVKE